MKSSQFFISTLKEVPAEAELPSHQLMLRAGLIKKVASGLYTWMPMGLRILKKIENVVREEMDRSGAIELVMPVVQPGESWQQSGRWEFYGKELLRFKDRHDRDFCLGPTHEEMITETVRSEITSYKQLPINFYQIQTKFRDEIRPRFGVMRSREFIMKDAYSFHTSVDSLKETYQVMYDAYSRIFDRLGLVYRPVLADNGSIGGTGSHEFQVLAENGEDTIVYSDESDYAANIELVSIPRGEGKRGEPKEKLTKVKTPGVKTIDELVKFLKVPVEKTLKSIVIELNDGKPALLLLRGDHEFNEVKAEKLPDVKIPLTMASAKTIEEHFHAHGGSLGPVGFDGPVYCDYAVEFGTDFVIGANEDDHHYTGYNFGVDSKEPVFCDLRNVLEGDPSPDGKGKLKFARGIEVGQVFMLGTKYSESMNCTYLDQNGKSQFMQMGCYGIGVTRVAAAAIEQNNDEKGIIWPQAMAPFDVVIVPMNFHKSEVVKEAALKLYEDLMDAGVDVLLDDRDERAGVLLHDAELIGFPHRIVIGEKSLKEGFFEYQFRKTLETQNVKIHDIKSFIISAIDVNHGRRYGKAIKDRG